MFAKIFSQIFDSSIARDHVVRHVFMDLLVLADRDGVVDMTLDAISRRTNVPEEMIRHAIQHLTSPDRASRSKDEDGQRLTPLDSHRDWGWQIVNYEHYRNLVDEESRRAYFRDKKRDQRKKVAKTSPTVQHVRDSPTLSKVVTQAEAEGEAEERGSAKPPVQDKSPTAPEQQDPSEAIYDFNQDPEQAIPDGLPTLQYSAFVLGQLNIPAGYALKLKTGVAIEMLAQAEGCSMAIATSRMLGRMRDAGQQKWNFWLEDGGWKAGTEDAVDRAFAGGAEQ